jgi:RNA polymerase sigma factor (sigma-70 family)
MQATNTHAAGAEKSQIKSSSANARQFDDVLSRCLPSLHRMALRKLRDAVEAEDAVQEALLSAYKHLDQFNGGAQMSTWLTTIVINAARMQLRRRSRHIHLSLDQQLSDEQEYSLAEQIASDSPSPEDVCRESELHEHVRGLLTRLSPRLRKVFQLRDLDGLTTREAAVILGVSAGTAKAQLMRARAKLRELMCRPPDAQFSAALRRAPVTVVAIRTKRPRVTSTVRLRVRRALARRGVLQGQIPGSLVAGRKVA